MAGGRCDSEFPSVVGTGVSRAAPGSAGANGEGYLPTTLFRKPTVRLPSTSRPPMTQLHRTTSHPTQPARYHFAPHPAGPAALRTALSGYQEAR